MTTASGDLSSFLRSVADWIEAGGSVEVVLWIIAVALVAWAAFDVWKWLRGRRQRRKPSAGAVADYTTACAIIDRYIDPDRTMGAGVRLTVRSQILAKFDKVVGAKIGVSYNGELLHQWLQKNAARTLVKHQDEIV